MANLGRRHRTKLIPRLVARLAYARIGYSRLLQGTGGAAKADTEPSGQAGLGYSWLLQSTDGAGQNRYQG